MTNSSLQDLSVQQLRQALAIRERMENLEKELTKIFGPTAPSPLRGGRRRRFISPAGRAALRTAARARWARMRTGKTRALPATRRSKRGAISAAGRARIAAAARARWAKLKAAGGRTLGDLGRKKRTLSPAARARIAAAARARWAKVKGSKTA